MPKTELKELLDSADIQVPTDFPPQPTAPGLRALDSALRCKICQELYDAPVVLTCGHCFCSLCARTQLDEKPVCPTCWNETTISSFRVNPAMEEAVTAWKDARRVVLGIINKATIEASGSPRPAKRHKSNAHATQVGSGLVSNAPQGRSAPFDPIGTTREQHSLSVGPADDDVGQESEQLQGNPSTDSECPICGKAVSTARINDHLDSNCKKYISSGKSSSLSKSGQKDAWSRLLDGKRSGKEKEAEVDTPIPKASYTVLKDKQIRDLLAAHDLSTAGDRSQLIVRHERWVALYNANLDRSSALRKRPVELRLEMRRWEEDRRGSRKAPLKIDITEHRRANKAEFDKLVQSARTKPGRESPKLSPDRDTLAMSSELAESEIPEFEPQLKRQTMASGGETDAIIVDSDPDS
ncbi:hypothetical protein BGW80DRAFT_1288714 [Lactifluus volemus]|nr:hypothetical protein BGW80DRAFT_1288714 [Lactifluus volemus]